VLLARALAQEPQFIVLDEPTASLDFGNQGKVMREIRALALQQIPFVLADPGLTYAVLPDEEIEGEAYDMVKVSFGTGVGDSPGDTYTLYVGKEDDMVAAIRYTVTYGRQPAAEANARPPAETQMLYQDYAAVDGLTVPTHFYGTNFADGAVVDFKNEAWAAEISYRQPFDATKLAMPEGARIQPPPGQ
jgi:hypothetical protein